MFGCNSIKEVYFSTATNRRLSGVSWSIIAPPFIHGHNYDPSSVPQDIADPIRIKHLIAAYTRHETEEYGTSKAEDSYGLLSEYSHPNAACFLPYREFDGRRAFFVPPPAQSTFGGINGFAVQWLMFAQELLGVAGESVIRDRLVRILQTIVEAAQSRS